MLHIDFKRSGFDTYLRERDLFSLFTSCSCNKVTHMRTVLSALCARLNSINKAMYLVNNTKKESGGRSMISQRGY